MLLGITDAEWVVYHYESPKQATVMPNTFFHIQHSISVGSSDVWSYLSRLDSNTTNTEAGGTWYLEVLQEMCLSALSVLV